MIADLLAERGADTRIDLTSRFVHAPEIISNRGIEYWQRDFADMSSYIRAKFSPRLLPAESYEYVLDLGMSDLSQSGALSEDVTGREARHLAEELVLMGFELGTKRLNILDRHLPAYLISLGLMSDGYERAHLSSQSEHSEDSVYRVLYLGASFNQN